MPTKRRAIRNRLRRSKKKARRAKKRATYLASPKGLAIETIKGLPRATRKVGGAISRAIKKYTKLSTKGIRTVNKAATPAIFRDLDKVRKAKGMDRNREIIKRFMGGR